MSVLRHRLRKIEQSLAAENRFRRKREVFWWEPTDPESTKVAMEQTFHTHERNRKFKIRIVGEPDKSVYKKIGKEIFPDKEKLRDLSDDELNMCTEKFVLACEMALTESRRKAGLPPLSSGKHFDSGEKIG